MIDSAELELLERSLRAAAEQHDGAALDAALDELGWPDAVADDRRAAVAAWFEVQGAVCATSASLERLIRMVLGVDAHAVALPSLGQIATPGETQHGRIRIDGLLQRELEPVDTVWVVVGTNDGAAAAVAATATQLEQRPIRGLDPSMGLVAVTGEVEDGEMKSVEWTEAITVAQLAVGHELVGASRTMLELARTHALDRVQFGQPIAKFQAIRHRLAETLVAIETAQAMLDAAWDDGSPTSSAMAKSLAGRSARITSRHCQQVLAGIGFTTEHVFHRYARRVLVLDQLFGASRTLARDLGMSVVERRELPALLPL
jgi:hypothetical protein